MNDEHTEDATIPHDAPLLSQDLLADLDFGPGWARKPAAVEHQEPRAPRRDKPDRGRDRPRSGDRPAGARQPRRDARPEFRSMPRPERVERAPVELSVIPDSKPLSAVIKRIRLARRAYPLLDVAKLFIANEGSCRIKVTLPRENPDLSLFICKTCKMIALDREGLEAHVAESHLDEYFAKEETETAAPEGQFVCVARCGMSGELLAPPNHHSYAEKLQQVHDLRFAHVPMEEYRKRVQIVRDEALIEQWKEQNRRQTIYRRKDGGETAAGLSWLEARALFMQDMAPTLVTRVKRATVPLQVALSTTDRSLVYTISSAWSREKRFPRTVLFALRTAFRHMGLHVFRNETGADVVTSIRPSALDTDHVVDVIREIIVFVGLNPGCTFKTTVEQMDADGSRGVQSQMGWLIEKGHLIEYADGSLALPAVPVVQQEKSEAK